MLRFYSGNYSLPVRSHSVIVFLCTQVFFQGFSEVYKLTLRLLMSYIYIYIYIYIYTCMEHLFLMFLDHTRRCTTVGRTPLDE